MREVVSSGLSSCFISGATQQISLAFGSGGFYGKRLSTEFNFGSIQSNTVLHRGYQKQIIVQKSIPRLKYHEVNGF
jgi:hypothetical protein